MDEKEIAYTVRQIESLAIQIADCQRAFVFYPTSLDLARQEERLSKRWNRLVSELTAAGVKHEYKLLTIYEEEPQSMSWMQEIFVKEGLDMRDLTREDDKPKSKALVSDGLGGLVDF